MGCMRDVRVRTQRTDAMFEPLVETVAVLQKYGIQVCDMTITCEQRVAAIRRTLPCQTIALPVLWSLQMQATAATPVRPAVSPSQWVKRCGPLQVSAEVTEQLQSAPQAWKSLNRKMTTR